jgi:glycosyltransferase 2 family protein
MMGNGPRGQRVGRSAIARALVGLLIGSAALCLSVRGVHWFEVGQGLARTRPGIVAAALFCQVLIVIGKAMRWRLLFAPNHERLTMPRMTALVLAGQLANSLLPGRLGDVARTYLGSENLSTAVVTGATVVVEKSLDGIMLLCLTAVTASLTALPPWLKYSTLTLSAFLALMMVGAVLVARTGGGLRQTLARWLQPWNRWRVVALSQQVLDAIGQLQALSDPGVQSKVWTLSVLVWLLGWITNSLVFLALGMHARLLESAVLMVVLMTGAIFPTVPAQLGVFHYLVVLTLGQFGVAADAALPYGLLLHWVVYAPVAVGGAMSILWLSRSTVLWGPFRRGTK